MTPDAMLDVLNRAIWMAAECTGPLLAIGGLTGMFMALIQAATQVSEPSLTFVPKLASLGLAFVFMGSWLIDKMVSFNIMIYTQIANVGP